MNGWIKLHRKVLNNDAMFRSGNTFPLFCILLLLADRNGRVTVGRNQLARWLKMKPSTVYLGLKRLQNMNTIQLKPNNKMTVVYICNWDEYQNKADIKVTTKQQQDNTIQEYRIENSIIGRTSEDVQPYYMLFIKAFNKNPNTYKLTANRKQKLRARLKDAGPELLSRAITNTANSPWHTGDNSSNWKADLDFIIRSYEQVEKLANLQVTSKKKTLLDKFKEERQLSER